MSTPERDRMADLRDRLDRQASRRGIPAHRQLVQVYDGGAIPTTVPKMFLTRPASIGAAEAEGAASTITPDTSQSIPVLVLGPLVPAAGDSLRAAVIGGRWVARKRGVASTCPTFFTVRGCNAVGVVGATVNVWTDASKTTLIATGTTGSGPPVGSVQLDIGFARSVYWEASKARFVTGGRTATITTCGVDSGGLLTLTPASGYHCKSGGCADPWADTLHGTDYLGNAFTLTYTSAGAAGWYGTVGPYTHPACATYSCVAVPNYSYLLRIRALVGVLEIDAQTASSSNLCPGTGFDGGYALVNNGADVCPYPGAASITNYVRSGQSSTLFCLSSVPADTAIFTITE